MIILEINAYHGDVSAAQLRDGKPVAAVEEERFRRVKHWARFPHEAISLPTTALGGASAVKDIAALIDTFGIIGAAAGSLFVFKGKYRAVLINYPSRADKDALIAQALQSGS